MRCLYFCRPASDRARPAGQAAMTDRLSNDPRQSNRSLSDQSPLPQLPSCSSAPRGESQTVTGRNLSACWRSSCRLVPPAALPPPARLPCRCSSSDLLILPTDQSLPLVPPVSPSPLTTDSAVVASLLRDFLVSSFEYRCILVRRQRWNID